MNTITLEQLLRNISTPGWDWPEGDFTWLASSSGLHLDSPDGWVSSIFFIHGGHIREQHRLRNGLFSVPAFTEFILQKSVNLESPIVRIMDAEEGSGQNFWIEGTRLPNQSDVDRLNSELSRRHQNDIREYARLSRIFDETKAK